MPYHFPQTVAGIVHDLSHLDPVTLETPSAKLGRSIRVWCWFTTHTFTKAAPTGHSGPLLLDEGRRPRVFCPDRYALSRYLPDAVRLLAHPDQYVWETASERNWLHRAEAVVTPRPGLRWPFPRPALHFLARR